MKLDDQIDKLFKDKLEDSNIPDIPQSFLDDINQRLDAISPQVKEKKKGFWSRGVIAAISVSIAIVFLIIFFAFFRNLKSNEAERIQNSILSDTINTVKVSISQEELNNKTADGNLNVDEESTAVKSLGTSDDSNNTDDNTNNTKPAASTRKQKGGNEKQVLGNVGSEKSITEQASKNSKKVKKGRENKEANRISNSVGGAENVTKNTKKNKKRSHIKGSVLTEKSSVDNNDVINDDASENKTALNEVVVKEKGTSKKNKAGKNKITGKNKVTAEKNISSIGVKKVDNEDEVKNNNLSEKKSSTNEKEQSGSDKKVKNVDETKKEQVNNNDQKQLDSLKSESKEVSLAKNVNTDSLKKQIEDSVRVIAKDSLKRTFADDTTVQLKDSLKSNKTNGFKSVQFLVGYSHINSTFKSQNANYDAKRKKEEESIWAFDASVLVNYIKNKFVYTLGLNYSQWGENIKYSAVTDSVKYVKGYDTTYVTQKIDSVTFIVNPMVNAIYANRAVTNDEVTLHNGKNTLSYLSIPFLLGYEFGNSTFSITPKIGGMVGIPIKSKCYYISPDLSKLVQEKAAPWRLNIQASVDMEAKISPYFSLCVSPVYRYNVTPLINSANTVNRYSGLGVQAGISYILH